MPTIDVQGADLSDAAIGRGETIVALHSSACSGAQWRGLAETIGGQYRLCAPDLIGYGSSDAWQAPGRLSLADEARRVEVLLDACEGPVHLVGHSYGGAVALKLARAHGKRLASLTLIEPVAFHLLCCRDPLSALSYGQVRTLADDVAEALRLDKAETAMRRFVEYWNGLGAWDALSQRQRDALLRVAPKVPHDFWATMTEPASVRDYAQITTPTLLIAGGSSPQPTRRIFELLATAISASQGVVLRGAGHMVPLTDPSRVNRVIVRHIAAHGLKKTGLPMVA